MGPAIKDVTFARGGDWAGTINLYEDDGETPIDTTGYEMEMTITTDDGTVHATLTTEGSAGIVHTPSLGQFNLSIEKEDIEAFPFSSAERRVIITDSTGFNTVLLIGNVSVR